MDDTQMHDDTMEKKDEKCATCGSDKNAMGNCAPCNKEERECDCKTEAADGMDSSMEPEKTEENEDTDSDTKMPGDIAESDDTMGNNMDGDNDAA